MSDPFREELRKQADEAVAKQISGMEHHLRMAFYAGVDFEMKRRQREQANASRTVHNQAG